MRTCSFFVWMNPVSLLLHLGRSTVVKVTYERKAFTYKRKVNDIWQMFM